jgi:hypothetical protein
MVFEILSSDSAVWIADLAAWCSAAGQPGRGVIPWFAKGRVAQFGVIGRFIGGLVFSFAAGLVAGCAIRRFGIRLVR